MSGRTRGQRRSSTPKPDLELLANGDILVPVEAAGGDWTVSRLTLDDPEYAQWLAIVQGRRSGSAFSRAVGFWSAGAFVLLAIFVGVPLLAWLILLVLNIT